MFGIFCVSFNVNSTLFFWEGGRTSSPNFSYHKIEMKEKERFLILFLN
jgi:hypothetical protein